MYETGVRFYVPCYFKSLFEKELTHITYEKSVVPVTVPLDFSSVVTPTVLQISGRYTSRDTICDTIHVRIFSVLGSKVYRVLVHFQLSMDLVKLCLLYPVHIILFIYTTPSFSFDPSKDQLFSLTEDFLHRKISSTL